MDQILWLTGMPRSGTTWISQIFASSPDVRVKFCPLFSYSFKNALDEKSTAKEWRDFFSKVYVTEDDYMDQHHLRRQGLVPDFPEKANPRTLLIKSNRFHNLTESILEKCQDLIFISIIRHPCAAINSWITNPLEFPQGQDPKQQWRSGSCRKTGPGEFWGFEDWKRVSTLHLRLARDFPNRFLIRRYERLMRSPLESSQEIFDKVSLKMTDSTKDFIAASQSRHDTSRRSVYKSPSKLDDWKDTMDPSISSQIYEELKGTDLAAFLEQ
ncbi:MAG: sulfotransferase [Deltaproteobacteria bacterium HGW-Deltaproteobacteria-15]|jgi:hypothetical protein|nr:MAG: sulfotransferase [Deltaproteobacteria bacterium HGW-Deltaproteobacteria-15]